MKASAAILNGSAVGLSALCLVHCLALPVVAAFLPLAGLWAEAEWVHKVLVLTALPITGFVILRHNSGRARLAFVVPALLGLTLLLAAAFAEPLHTYETPLTIVGAILLASAHAWHWAKRSAPSSV